MPNDTATTPNRRNLKILVVEDDVCLKTTMIHTLRQIDNRAEIDWVITAEKALSLITELALESDAYDVIVADIGLPGEKSGLDFWQYCKTLCPDTLFVFSSGMPVDRFLTYLRNEMVCPPLLSKPFSTGECRQVLSGLLESRNLKAGV